MFQIISRLSKFRGDHTVCHFQDIPCCYMAETLEILKQNKSKIMPFLVALIHEIDPTICIWEKCCLVSALDMI